MPRSPANTDRRQPGRVAAWEGALKGTKRSERDALPWSSDPRHDSRVPSLFRVLVDLVEPDLSSQPIDQGACACAWGGGCGLACMCWRACVCVHLHACVHLRACVRVCVHLRASACVRVRVRVCACVRGYQTKQEVVKPTRQAAYEEGNQIQALLQEAPCGTHPKHAVLTYPFPLICSDLPVPTTRPAEPQPMEKQRVVPMKC